MTTGRSYSQHAQPGHPRGPARRAKARRPNQRQRTLEPTEEALQPGHQKKPCNLQTSPGGRASPVDKLRVRSAPTDRHRVPGWGSHPSDQAPLSTISRRSVHMPQAAQRGEVTSRRSVCTCSETRAHYTQRLMPPGSAVAGAQELSSEGAPS